MALLSTLAKLLERIVLRRLSVVLNFGERQFGSRRKCGTHDLMANVLEFLHQNNGMHRMIVYIDVEGGFNKHDQLLHMDFLVAMGSSPEYNAWIEGAVD